MFLCLSVGLSVLQKETVLSWKSIETIVHGSPKACIDTEVYSS